MICREAPACCEVKQNVPDPRGHIFQISPSFIDAFQLRLWRNFFGLKTEIENCGQ